MLTVGRGVATITLGLPSGRGVLVKLLIPRLGEARLIDERRDAQLMFCVDALSISCRLARTPQLGLARVLCFVRPSPTSCLP